MHDPGKRSWLEIFGGHVQLRRKRLTDSSGKKLALFIEG